MSADFVTGTLYLRAPNGTDNYFQTEIQFGWPTEMDSADTWSRFFASACARFKDDHGVDPTLQQVRRDQVIPPIVPVGPPCTCFVEEHPLLGEFVDSDDCLVHRSL